MNRLSSTYFSALSADFQSARDLAKSILGYCPPCGALPTTLLRKFLERHLPDSVRIGTGIIVAGQSRSSEISVLVIDKSLPPLLAEDDVMIVLAESVRAVIEVRGRLDDPEELRSAVRHFTHQLSVIQKGGNGRKVWAGLFIIETTGLTVRNVFDALENAQKPSEPSIDVVALGENNLINWQENAINGEERGWHNFKHSGDVPASFVAHLRHAIAGSTGDRFPQDARRTDFRSA